MPWKLLFSSWSGGGGKEVGKAQSPLPLRVVRCPIATSGHYKSCIVGIQHFLILATVPIYAKMNQHVLFSLKSTKIASIGKKENHLNRGENSEVYLDS